MSDIASTFVAELSAAGPDLLRLVCNHLRRRDRRSLRGVNRAMRRSVNATVTHIACEPASLPARELLHVFPNVSSLDLRLATLEVDLAWFILHLARSSGRMLARIQHLKLEVDRVHPGVSIGGSLGLLSMYGSGGRLYDSLHHALLCINCPPLLHAGSPALFA